MRKSQTPTPPASPVQPEPDLPNSLRKFHELPDEAEVAQPVVELLFDISSATVWRWARAGLIPKPRRRGLRAVRWRVGELRAVLTEKAPTK